MDFTGVWCNINAMDPQHARGLRLEDGGFFALVLIVTIAFVWLLMPYFGAILWGIVIAILFAPINRRLAARFGRRRNLAAALTLLMVLLLVILPAFLVGISLVEEATGIYVKIQSGEIDFARVFNQLRESLPDWASSALESRGVTDFEAALGMLGSNIASGLQNIASIALGFGTGALRFLASLGVMLYLTFFLLRDGGTLGTQIKSAMPLRQDLRDELLNHFIIVVRATVKGSLVVAIVQGVVGGLIFWMLGIEGALLWGLLMGFFALVPAVGTGIVWVPVAIYLFLIGSILEGVILVACGIFVIGLIDNVLRPILVGRDTRLPDFVVLIATLAGLELFGLNGFIVGPVIAALFIAVWKIVGKSRERHEADPAAA